MLSKPIWNLLVALISGESVVSVNSASGSNGVRIVILHVDVDGICSTAGLGRTACASHVAFITKCRAIVAHDGISAD